jgi:hypothetical protein
MEYVSLANLAVSVANLAILSVLLAGRSYEPETPKIGFFAKKKAFEPKVFKPKSGLGEAIINELKK